MSLFTKDNSVMNAIFQICNENTKGGSTMFYDNDTAMKGFAISCKVRVQIFLENESILILSYNICLSIFY